MESLTEKVLSCQRSSQGFDDLVKELAPRVYQFPRRTMGWDEDACGDFYLYFHPRLLRLLARFRDQGKPFESYFCAVLAWQLRNFARERRIAERSRSLSLRLLTAEECSPPSEGPVELWPGASPDCRSGSGGIEAALFHPEVLSGALRTDSDRRNFLFLLLKCSRAIGMDRAEMLAPFAGVSAETLCALAEALKEKHAHGEKRLECLRGRRNRAFFKSRMLESEIPGETDADRKARLEEKLAKARRRLSTAMDRMARVGLSPTNREIALALGVPKGTVDSGLFWLKRKLHSVYDPDSLRTA